jgi:hypothetical protein
MRGVLSAIVALFHPMKDEVGTMSDQVAVVKAPPHAVQVAMGVELEIGADGKLTYMGTSESVLFGEASEGAWCEDCDTWFCGSATATDEAVRRDAVGAFEDALTSPAVRAAIEAELARLLPGEDSPV